MKKENVKQKCKTKMKNGNWKTEIEKWKLRKKNVKKRKKKWKTESKNLKQKWKKGYFFVKLKS